MAKRASPGDWDDWIVQRDRYGRLLITFPGPGIIPLFRLTYIVRPGNPPYRSDRVLGSFYNHVPSDWEVVPRPWPEDVAAAVEAAQSAFEQTGRRRRDLEDAERWPDRRKVQARASRSARKTGRRKNPSA